MEIAVFTEGSRTTIGDSAAESALDLFQGMFLPVKDIAMNLDEYGDVSVHILSDEYGYLRGSDPVSRVSEIQDGVYEFSQSISKVSKTADVVVILLTRSTFEETVATQWIDLSTNAKERSIWCLGASEKALSGIDIDELRLTANKVIVYPRVGVAMISSEAKGELLKSVEDMSDQELN